MLGDFPPPCQKQELGLVLSASPPLQGAGLRCWQTAPTQAPSKYLQPGACQAFRFKSLGKSRDSETANSAPIHPSIGGSRSGGVPAGHLEVPAHPQRASSIQDIPWQPFGPCFPLTSLAWQHWDSPEAALAESNSFLALVSFFLHCIKSIGQLRSVQGGQAGTEAAFRPLNSCQRSRRAQPRPPRLIWSLTVTVGLCKREKSPTMTAREGHSPQL